jgi:hypothetical protein
MLKQKLETVLILEGSVDWDVRIKEQLYSLSQNLPSATPEHPYGLDWMAMWLSHCGDDAHQGWQKHVEFSDRTLASTTHRADLDPPEADTARGVYRSKSEPQVTGDEHETLLTMFADSGCTVAYAVTAAGAQKILDEIGFEHVNLALDKAEGKTYSLPGLVVAPPLFQEWEQEEDGIALVADDFRLGQSIRKALYHQHR